MPDRLDDIPIFTEEEKTIASAVWHLYGARKQMMKLSEECAELIQVSQKHQLCEIPIEGMAEELADVLTMIGELLEANPRIVPKVRKIIDQKLYRTYWKLEKERLGYETDKLRNARKNPNSDENVPSE